MSGIEPSRNSMGSKEIYKELDGDLKDTLREVESLLQLLHEALDLATQAGMDTSSILLEIEDVLTAQKWFQEAYSVFEQAVPNPTREKPNLLICETDS